MAQTLAAGLGPTFFCDPNTSVLGPRGQGRAEMAVTLEKMGKYTTHGSYQMLKVVLLPLQASRPI